MKLIALSSTVRRALLNGRNQNCNRLGSAAETRLLCAGGANGGFFYWKRTMASPAEAKFPEKEKAEAEKSVVESSYWGISRPKVVREDGTEWPWNCFMVRILFLIRNQGLTQFLSVVD